MDGKVRSSSFCGGGEPPGVSTNVSSMSRRSSSFGNDGEVNALLHSNAQQGGAARPRKYDVSSTMNRLRSSLVGQRRYSDAALDEMDRWQEGETGEDSSALEIGGRGGSKTAATTYSSMDDRAADRFRDDCEGAEVFTERAESAAPGSVKSGRRTLQRRIRYAVHQIPAVALIGMFHLMIGIPFGVSYFPIGWRADSSAGTPASEDGDGVDGLFPLPGKESLGIRMFLFSTVVGQIVFTFTSGFVNPIGLQMVENVPFCHALSATVIKRVGYGEDALSTLIVMFGLASILVGVVFYVLGHFELGRIIYFFPTHVLVGCISGIGIFIAKTGVEVTMNAEFGLWEVFVTYRLLLAPVLAFEVLLRVLEVATRDADGKQRYSLLSPIYFCMITPVFYAVLWMCGVPLESAEDSGFFFPPLDACPADEDGASDCSAGDASSIFNPHLFDMWTVVDFSTVSWAAILDCTTTLVALVLFSLIHVPINIPAFAISTNTEVDMNNELVAHGFSNVIAGCLGGLQNYMAYTQSVLYDKSGGRGRPSGVAVAAVTACLFVVGPTVASYIPRCMAGTLLLHVGIDLFLEGVYDSFGKFDKLEYAGIWLITVVMTMYGMDAAMVAGVIAAVSTYAVQSVAYLSPIRGHMSAVTLRSSHFHRSHKANEILDDDSMGRNRILVVQLQGHLFFGNMAHLTESISELLTEKRDSSSPPLILIMDCSLVLGIDSSAVQALIKLRTAVQKKFLVELVIFVPGSSDGFPCEFDLSKELSSAPPNASIEDSAKSNHDEEAGALLLHKARAQECFAGSRVCESLDEALAFSEDALVARRDPTILKSDISSHPLANSPSSIEEERELALQYLANACSGPVEMSDVEKLFALFEREVFHANDFIWRQGEPSDCAKLLVHGSLIALLENEAGTSETVACGNLIGELGLVQGVPRLSSVRCLSDEAVVYSIHRKSYEGLLVSNPLVARFVDSICIKYLANRVQHVSNRIFETRCLPI